MLALARGPRVRIQFPPAVSQYLQCILNDEGKESRGFAGLRLRAEAELYNAMAMISALRLAPSEAGAVTRTAFDPFDVRRSFTLPLRLSGS
jgi:hypothetical protein